MMRQGTSSRRDLSRPWQGIATVLTLAVAAPDAGRCCLNVRDVELIRWSDRTRRRSRGALGGPMIASARGGDGGA